ncbi:MAG: tetratricopeptide repeat protein [Balneolales bacterium]
MILHQRSIIAFILIFLLIFSVETMAQDSDDIEALVNQAQAHYVDKQNEEALEDYLKVLEIEPTHYEALHKTSLLYNMIGFQLEDEDEQHENYKLAKKYGELAVEHHPDKDESHYVYSIAVGRITDFSSSRERVRLAPVIKEHGEKAIEINPEHAGAWHLLAVWHHNASNLNFAERTAVRVLGGLPDSSNERAEKAFKKAIALDNETIIFYLDFARFYEDMGEDEKAKQMLNKAVALEPKIEGDEKYLKESKDMLASLG